MPYVTAAPAITGITELNAIKNAPAYNVPAPAAIALDESITRLMRSVLIEINDARASRKAIFTNKTYQDLIDSTIPAKLIDIATEQRNLLAA